MRFVDPKNDLAFKKIFGDENKTEVLISFLNSVLDFKDGKAIVSTSLTNPCQPKTTMSPRGEHSLGSDRPTCRSSDSTSETTMELKETILDIKATNQDGESFIVEMQNKRNDFDNIIKHTRLF